MAKKSPAKVKMLVAQAKREAAVARAAKQPQSEFIKSNEDTELERYTGLDEAWREIGIALPARRALIDDGLFQLSDLRKVSLDALKELPGMSPNAVRILVNELKKADLSFRK